MKSCSDNFSTKPETSHLKHGLNVLKTQNTTKSKTWLKVSLKMSLYIINNLLGDDSRYPTISHKKCFVPNVNVLDFVGEFFWRYLSDLKQTVVWGKTNLTNTMQCPI